MFELLPSDVTKGGWLDGVAEDMKKREGVFLDALCPLVLTKNVYFPMD